MLSLFFFNGHPYAMTTLDCAYVTRSKNVRPSFRSTLLSKNILIWYWTPTRSTNNTKPKYRHVLVHNGFCPSENRTEYFPGRNQRISTVLGTRTKAHHARIYSHRKAAIPVWWREATSSTNNTIYAFKITIKVDCSDVHRSFLQGIWHVF